MSALELGSESIGLVERSAELAALAELLTAARGGQGRVALVYGEAGIGKTTLVRRFCEDAGDAAGVLWGACDALFTPRPLGPLLDIALDVGGELGAALADEATPYAVETALEHRLAARAPTILVLEDMHLADEATLDVLRLLGRRVAELPVLMIVTYRDDALDRWHPLRVVLGEVAASSPARLRLSRLSLETVVRMGAAQGIAGEELHLRTGGNPFFVTEVLASGDERIPETVRDVVLGRAARLSPSARRVIDAVAVARPQCELSLLRALVRGDIDALEEAVASGILSGDPGSVVFRHELARLAVEEAIPADRREALHRQALGLLADPGDGVPDPARLAHHAEVVGDGRLVLEFAPRAAVQASRLGAHREAAAHYRRALRFAELEPLEARADLFAQSAQESYLISEFEAAVLHQEEAARCYEQLGDRLKQGGAQNFLSQLLWQTGSLQEGLAAVTAALGLLEDLPGPALVDAYGQMAALQLAAEDPPTALVWARRGRQLAATLDDPWSSTMSLQVEGWVEYFTGTPGGLEKLVESLEMAHRYGIEWAALTAYVIIVRTACRRRDYETAEPYLRAGLELCGVGDYDVWRYYLVSWQSKMLLAQGRWTEAAEVAEICLAHPCPYARVHALVALGLVRARRGDPDVWVPLDEGVALAEPRHELQWTATVAIARAEAAWLEGRNEDVIAETQDAYDQAAGTWWAAGLGYWRWRAGADEPIPDIGEEPYRLEMAGEWSAAADGWRAIGCPYEAAFALLDAGDDASLRAALEEFQRLGAAPAIRLATARLRAIGARGVPRGPQRSTLEQPANLTRREVEVLGLVALGLRNAEIAAQLFVAEKTVDHHVSAILRKLGVVNRAQAAVAATRLGIPAER